MVLVMFRGLIRLGLYEVRWRVISCVLGSFRNFSRLMLLWFLIIFFRFYYYFMVFNTFSR